MYEENYDRDLDLFRIKINLPIMIGRIIERRAGLVSHLLTTGLIPSLWCTYHEQISFRPGINPDLL
jgi:hypothetical protein